MDYTAEVIAAAEEVHDILGAGYTESTYHTALERELSERGVPFTSECTVPIYYKGSVVGKYRPDMFVLTDGGTIIIELKAGSDRGEEQLSQYVTILNGNENFTIDNGILIRFNDSLEIVQS